MRTDPTYTPHGLKAQYLAGEIQEMPARWPGWIRALTFVVASGLGWAAVVMFIVSWRVAVR